MTYDDASRIVLGSMSCHGLHSTSASLVSLVVHIRGRDRLAGLGSSGARESMSLVFREGRVKDEQPATSSSLFDGYVALR